MFKDNENDNGMENTETGDENDDGMRNIESGDESDDESDDKNDDETEDDPEIPVETRKFLKPGKNEEGWWTADHLLDQVINYAIPIFETKYPNSISIFAFDNSTNHEAITKDALNVNKINVNPGGKQAIMRLTFFGLNHTFQSIVFPL